MTDDEKEDSGIRPSPLETHLPQVLQRLATHADVSLATLKEAIREQSFEKNMPRRRIGKALVFFKYTGEELRKALIVWEKKKM